MIKMYTARGVKMMHLYYMSIYRENTDSTHTSSNHKATGPERQHPFLVI